MEAFKFSLNRVRNYKSQVLDKEKKVLGTLQRKRDEILEKVETLEKYRDDKIAELSFKQQKGATMSELLSFNYLIENARLQIQAALLELYKAEEEVEAQRQVVITVYQEKTGMDKLEEKQVEEYRLLEAKSAENEIMQVISNRMADKSRNSNSISGIA
ncbi:MAG: flagellar export protein FliJ [Clostridiales bacterium]|nr:flagellar export protein FliJ [Clostridiales bacterium]